MKYVITAICCWMLLSSWALAERYVLVENGRARASVVVSPNPEPAVRLASWELRHAIHNMTGVWLEEVQDSKAVKGTAIFIGRQDHPLVRQVSLRLKRDRSYAVWSAERAIVLLGKDSKDSTGQSIDIAEVCDEPSGPRELRLPGMYDLQGSLKASYDFLYEQCGVRYYGPKAASMDVIPMTNLVVDFKSSIKEVSMKHSSGSLTWQWPLNHIPLGSPSGEEIQLYERRMGLGGIPWVCNHTMYHYEDRFKASKQSSFFEKDRPEFFPDSKSLAGQLCYSSEALVEQVAQDARDYFDGKKVNGLVLPAGSEYFPVVPNDCGNYCDCEPCTEVLSKNTHQLMDGQPHFNNGQASDYWFGFVNKVAKALAKTHPDRYIATLAYEQYFWMPSFPLEPNISVAMCVNPRMSGDQRLTKNEEYWYHRWVRSSKRGDIGPLFAWNYYCFPEEPAVMRKWNCFPGFSSQKVSRWIKRAVRDGLQGVNLCGGGEHFDFYLTMQLYRDASQNPKKLKSEFFSRYFKASGAAMERFYDLIEERYNDESVYGVHQGHQTPKVAWENLGDATLMKALEEAMSLARSKADTETTKWRVDAWDRGFWQYMKKGHEDYQQRFKALRALPKHDRIAKGYVMGVETRASWEVDQSSLKTVLGHQMIESEEGVLGTRDAKCHIVKDADAHWAALGPKHAWIEFDLGELKQIEELRIWNYQQNVGYGLNERGMRQVKIETNVGYDLSQWTLLKQTEIPIADDREAFGPSLVLPINKNIRLLRITAVGERGVGNWFRGTRQGRWAGLSQVRFYEAGSAQETTLPKTGEHK